MSRIRWSFAVDCADASETRSVTRVSTLALVETRLQKGKSSVTVPYIAVCSDLFLPFEESSDDRLWLDVGCGFVVEFLPAEAISALKSQIPFTTSRIREQEDHLTQLIAHLSRIDSIIADPPIG